MECPSLAILVLIGFVGCSHDEFGPERTLDSVPVDDLIMACEDAAVADDVVWTLACYRAAMHATEQNPADCEAFALDCASQDVGFHQTDCVTWSEEFAASLPACASMVTLGALQDCMLAMKGAMETEYDRISCDSEPLLPEQEECERLIQGCPELAQWIWR